jgi:hypothetical protein
MNSRRLIRLPSGQSTIVRTKLGERHWASTIFRAPLSENIAHRAAAAAGLRKGGARTARDPLTRLAGSVFNCDAARRRPRQSLASILVEDDAARGGIDGLIA